MRFSDLVAATGLSKATVHRLLANLQRVGFVELDEAGSAFHLGFELFALGISAANRHGIVELADQALTRLASRTADTVFLSSRSGADSICLARREGSFPIRALTLAVGDRRPLGVGAGSLALLAGLPDAEIDKVIGHVAPRLEAYPGYGAAQLYDLVEQTRRHGFAFNRGAIIPEMWAVAVAVPDPDGRPVAALSIATIRSRMARDRRASIVAWLGGEAATLAGRVAALSSRLGPAGRRDGGNAVLQRALGLE